MGYAHTRDEAWSLFVDGFAADWDLIAQADDADLTLDARELKQKLLELVDRVEEAKGDGAGKNQSVYDDDSYLCDGPR